jgi:hypothetical protein
MLKSHFHAFSRDAPLGGCFIEIFQIAPLASAQLCCSKKRQNHELQCKLGLLLAAVGLQERGQL